MRMTITDSSTRGVDIATAETIRANNSRNVWKWAIDSQQKLRERFAFTSDFTYKYSELCVRPFMLGVVSARVTEFFAVPRSG